MPFTPTHILAALPLWPIRRFLPFEALAIGTMVPDFPLFFPVIHYAQTHTIAGAFLFCMPIGVTIYLIFEMACRKPLRAILHSWVQQRIDNSSKIPLAPNIGTQLTFFFGVFLAVVLGALSHQVWDAFTHEGRWGTAAFPSLNSEYSVFGKSLTGYKLFQYGSTIVGLPFLGLVVLAVLQRSPKRYPVDHAIDSRLKWIAVTMLVVIPSAIASYLAINGTGLYQLVGTTIKTSSATIAIMLVVYCIGYHMVPKNCNDQTKRDE